MAQGTPPPSIQDLSKDGLTLDEILDRADDQTRNARNFRNSPGNNTLTAFLRDFAAKMFTGLDPLAAETARAGMGRLLQMIVNNGQIDPQFINDQLRRNQRDTDVELRSAQADAARSGLRTTGAGAMQAAIRDAGSRRGSQIIADENQRAIDQQQQNLALLGQIAINPALGAADIQTRRFLGTRDMGANPALQGLGTALGLLGQTGIFSGQGGNTTTAV